MARFLAVVTIQPAGFGGTPVSGQRSAATRNASWTASSATSMSPKRRTRVAIAWPDSSRKTCSTVSAAADTGSTAPARPETAAPRPVAPQATVALRAQARAASRSGASMIQNPPSCSFDSGNGPSVRMISPSACARATVAVDAGCRPPPNTHTPSRLISSLSASTSAYMRSIVSCGGSSSPSIMYTDNRYCVIVNPPSRVGSAPYRPSITPTNGDRPKSTHLPI